MLQIKRIYDPYIKEDGYRILVDRLWPRGISKEKAKLDIWFKEIAPSTELRKWFRHEPAKWKKFEKKYNEELSKNKELLTQLKNLEKTHKHLTLLYGARDTEHNEAVVLYNLLNKE